MKKISLLVLCTAIIFSLCGCNKKQDEIKVPVNFYYCKEEVTYHAIDGVIQAEIREAELFNDNAETMLHAYLLGPYSSDYISPVPSNTKLISVRLSGQEAFLLLSDEFAQLSGIKLSLACSCITMTLAEYLGVETVHFSTESMQLDNKDEVVLNILDIILLDTVEKEG